MNTLSLGLRKPSNGSFDSSFFTLAMNLRAAPHRKAPQNGVLEEVFSERKTLSEEQIHEKAIELNMTERQVERWLRQRKLQDRPTTLEKFSETG